LTAEGTTSKGRGSISCEVEFCIFYRLSLRTLRTKDVKREPGVALGVRCCATSLTVPGSIPGGVTGFFTDISPSDRTMVLGSTQPLVKMSTRNISWG
jgi:hypothetical protein